MTTQQRSPTPSQEGTVTTKQKIWRAKLPSRYIEPDLGPDLLDGQELIFKEYGKSIRKQKFPLPPRDDIIVFDPTIHQAEFDRNIRWHNCPNEYRAAIEDLIKRYWDVFAEEGLSKHIRGFSICVDTGNVAPVCCKPPRYGPHEARVIRKLLEHLQNNHLIEPDDGPWGALIVLAAKPGQENMPWYEYIWRLCVSYRRLNQVVRPFSFPVPRCDDAVADIGPNMKYFLSFDLDCGYWQVFLEKESRSKTAFFTSDGKMRWTVMPMGFLNSHAVLVAMMASMKEEWNAKAKNAGITLKLLVRGNPTPPSSAFERYGSKIIVDDVLLYSEEVPILINYFEIVLQVLQHYRVTIKLKKCKFLLPSLEFVGIDVTAKGNSPARDKFKAFRALPPPTTWSELRMVIGTFGFYQKWLERFEVRIAPFRRIQTFLPKPGGLSIQEEQDAFAGFWREEHSKIFEQLKKDILSAPIVARYDPNVRCYVKTDWSKVGMGAVLLQPDITDKAAFEAMLAKDLGGPCFFDLQKNGLRLRAIECRTLASLICR